MPFDLLTGKFIPEKSNIWRDCVDGMHDWVKEHIEEVRGTGRCGAGGSPLPGSSMQRPAAFARRVLR